MRAPRLIMVSNRLPVTVQESAAGVELKPSAGGLATGLGSFYQEFDVLWVGWPGTVSRSRHAEVEARLASEHNCRAVFLSDRLVEKYYDGFSNRALWPLFHSFQGYAKYSGSEWKAYVEANERFMDALAKELQPGDQVWVHDYQLLLLPGMIRKRFPGVSVGFFLHIPFPSHDVFRQLPQHKEIVKSLAACDLAGFHTHDYVRAFLDCVQRILGLESRMGEVIVGDRILRTGVFPMGIDFERFSKAARALQGSPTDREMKAMTHGAQLILSVSRLDYTKGIPQGLVAFEDLIRKRPDRLGKMTFVLVVVPSREKVDRYGTLKAEIDQIVGRINSEFGTLDWVPIRYIYRSLSFEELVCLYMNADVCLVSPLRDGMNLVAKEYVASHVDDQGVLILSEMAGASRELTEAMNVNPNSNDELVVAMEGALEMGAAEQERRMRSMRTRLSENHVRRWAETFVSRLKASAEATRGLRESRLDGKQRARLIETFGQAERRLILLDYDGTLVRFHGDPSLATPDPDLLALVGELAGDPRNQVAIVSGRDRQTLGTWFQDLRVMLAAEHGSWVRESGAPGWRREDRVIPTDWKTEVRPILEAFVEDIPGSMIEEKDYSLVWHYRKAESTSSAHASRDLVATLLATIGNQQVQILPGNKTIEVRSHGLGKGAFFRRLAAERNDSWDLIFAAGDDFTDEELFSALPAAACSIKVGQGHTRARLRVVDVSELRAILVELAGLSGPRGLTKNLTGAETIRDAAGS